MSSDDRAAYAATRYASESTITIITIIVPHDMVYNRREEGKQGEGDKLWEFPRGRKEGGGAYPPQGKTTNFFPTALSRHSSLPVCPHPPPEALTAYP